MATTITQAGRPLQVGKTPLDDPDGLVPLRLVGSEGLSRPFNFVVDFLSPTAGLGPEKLLGRRIGLMVFGAPNTTRLVHGRVSQWVELGSSGSSGLTHYRAELVPSFWLLSLASDCRTFENRTVRDIVETVLAAHTVRDVRFSLIGPQPTVPYAVQYQESDFAFVSRLLEEHGLYYTFEHQLDKDVLVITDRIGSLVPEGVLAKLKVDKSRRKAGLPNIPGVGPPGKKAGEAAGAAVGGVVGSLLGPFGSLGGAAAGAAVASLVEDLINKVFGPDDRPVQNVVTELFRERRVHTKTMAARDFHLLRAADADSATSGHPGVSGEHFEFLGDLAGTPDAGEVRATTRRQMEVKEAVHDVLRGGSTACTLTPGTRVTITDGILGSAGSELHLLEVAHVVDAGNLLTGEQAEVKYVNEFAAIPVATQYRPERTTGRPSVLGTQIAEVVGAGDAGQIDVDASGRVLLKFPWDRGDGKDGKSQHRVHVAGLWSGVGWGEIHHPRVGQLVLAEFLEGDPDRPIVTGRVYSRNHAHPYALPTNKTQSGFKSRTLGGGDANFNELRFEDKQGEEHVFLQAEKELLVKVKSDETDTVGHDRTVTVQHNDHLEVKDGEHKLLITKGNQIILAHEGNQFLRVGTGDQDVSVKEGNQSIATLGGNQTVEVNGDQTVTVKKGDQTIVVKDGKTAYTVETGTFELRALNDDLTVHADVGDIAIKADAGKIRIEAAMEIEIKVGACSIKIAPSGITIKGPTVKVDAQGQAEIKSAAVKVEGSGMLQLKAPVTQLNGDGMLMAKGGLTMIN